MKLVLNRHYPVYPVCDEDGMLVGLVRGQAMFEEQAYRDQRAGRHDGRRGEGGAARHAAGSAASSSAIRGCSSTCSPRSSPRRWSASSRTRSTGS